MIPVGTEIDASDFRKVDLLVAQRYLKPLDPVVDQSLESQVVAIVLKHAQEGGDLASLFTPQTPQVKRGRPKNKTIDPAN